jgi:predicted O-methyltransferase YrrM
LVSGADAAATIVSVERDANLATRTAELFAEHPNVRIVHGDWTEILADAPFDLLVLDGGGAAKHDDAIDPAVALAAGGMLVIDDFTPSNEWPPVFEGAPDAARMHWFEHPLLSAAEIRTTAETATIVASRRG